jgi:N6-adenosine-specific RNA methylase IME4
MNADEFRAFRDDIARRGIQVPLDITAKGVVLDGRTRLAAATELGWDKVPVRTVNPADQREYVLLCALRRKHLTASQQATIALDLEEYQQAKTDAPNRQKANLKNQAEVATLPPRNERSRDIAARLTNGAVSARVIQDAATVRAADPALYEEIRQGRTPAHAAARQVRRRKRDTNLQPPPPLPEGPFQLIYADPPWQLGNPNGAYAPENHYATMPLAKIKALAIPAAAGALLLLWAVNALLPQALEVMLAWGFTYKANLAWVKPSIGLGNWVRNRHELLLLGVKGRFPLADPEDRPDSVIEAARGRHSQKPLSVYELIERAWPKATKLELFGRGKPRAGWANWGNEALA